MRLRNKTAIITGAGSGFGAAMAIDFAKEGARVVVNDISEGSAREVVKSIREDGGEAIYCQANVARGDDVQRMIQTALNAYGGFNILVNNAGVPQWNQPLTETDESTFDSIFNVNVKGIYFTSIYGIAPMRNYGGGLILHIASTAAIRPRPGLAWYNASKGAVANLTLSMSQELAPEIRVNALCPVATETPMLDSFLGGNREKIDDFQATIPMGRLGQPLDLARAATFLASEDASFLTGVLLPVDGGRCAA